MKKGQTDRVLLIIISKVLYYGGAVLL